MRLPGAAGESDKKKTGHPGLLDAGKGLHANSAADRRIRDTLSLLQGDSGNPPSGVFLRSEKPQMTRFRLFRRLPGFGERQNQAHVKPSANLQKVSVASAAAATKCGKNPHFKCDFPAPAATTKTAKIIQEIIPARPARYRNVGCTPRSSGFAAGLCASNSLRASLCGRRCAQIRAVCPFASGKSGDAP